MSPPIETDQRRSTFAAAEPVPGWAVLAAMPDPFVLLISPVLGRWRIQAVNAAYESATGWQADEVVGTEPLGLVGPLTEPDLLDSAAAEASSGGLVRRRIVLHHRDGTPLWCELRGGLLPQAPGEPVQAWAQLVLESTAAGSRFRRLLENITDTIAVLDGDGVIRYASPSVDRLGFVPELIEGHSVFDRLDPAHHGEHMAFWHGVLVDGGVHGPAPLTIFDPGGVGHAVEVVLNNRLEDPEVHGIIVTARSIADRVAAEEVAGRLERRLRALVQHASDIVVVLDDLARVSYASPSVERVLGPLATDAGHILELFHPEDLPRALGAIGTRLGEAGHTGVMELRLRAPDGSWTWFELAATNLLDDPDVAGVVLNGRDISERRKTDDLLAGELSVLETMAGNHTLAPVLHRLAEVAESFIPGAACSIGILDEDGVIRHPAAPTLAPEIVAGLDATPPSSALGCQVRGGERVVYRDVASDPRWGELGDTVVRNGLRACWWVPVRSATAEEILGVVVVMHPVSRGPHPSELPVLDRIRHLATLALERGRFERRLEHQALHDSLTGLPNRSLLLDRVSRALEVGRGRGTHTAVLFVDLDRFKLVNDSLGHAAGDELLGQVAERFSGAIRLGDTVGRFGGDEFVVVAENVLGEAGALAAGEQLLAALHDPMTLVDQQVRVSASIGVAMAGPDADDVGGDAMIRNADAAMYRAKDAGRGRVCLFEETLHAEAVRRYDLEQGLRSALERGELVLQYQPRVRLTDGQLTGVEALVRWDRPGSGRIGADELVPIAEDTGLIVPIGAWVLDTACRQAVAWDGDPSTDGLLMSVNLSGRQLGDPELVDVVAGTLAATGLAPERLCLEVTESALAADPDTAVESLTALAALGVHLAIDDFGTGYATLDYVRRFAMADELKIDRSFVAGLADLHSPDAAIVSAALVLADALGFEVVAEGVETPEQLAVLRRLGCRSAQGFYFGAPMPPEEISR